MYKTNTRCKDIERQFLLWQSWKSDNYMESNREKSNIAIAILAKRDNLIAPKLFCILGAPIIFCLLNIIYS